MDKYFIVWTDSYGTQRVNGYNSQGECEKEIDIILEDGVEITAIIVGTKLKWRVNTQIILEEE